MPAAVAAAVRVPPWCRKRRRDILVVIFHLSGWESPSGRFVWRYLRALLGEGEEASASRILLVPRPRCAIPPDQARWSQWDEAARARLRNDPAWLAARQRIIESMHRTGKPKLSFQTEILGPVSGSSTTSEAPGGKVHGHVVEPEAHGPSLPPCRDVTPGNDPLAPCGPNPNCGPVLVTAIRRSRSRACRHAASFPR